MKKTNKVKSVSKTPAYKVELETKEVNIPVESIVVKAPSTFWTVVIGALIGILIATVWYVLAYAPKAGASYRKNSDCEFNCFTTPIPTPTATPTPTRKPKCSPTPTITPEPVKDSPAVVNAVEENRQAPMCSEPSPAVHAWNFNIERHGDYVIARWIPGDGSTADIFFKENYVTGWPHAWTGDNTGYARIDHLVPTESYTFKLKTRNKCSDGTEIVPVVVDDYSARIFPTTYWEVN